MIKNRADYLVFVGYAPKNLFSWIFCIFIDGGLEFEEFCVSSFLLVLIVWGVFEGPILEYPENKYSVDYFLMGDCMNIDCFWYTLIYTMHWPKMTDTLVFDIFKTVQNPFTTMHRIESIDYNTELLIERWYWQLKSSKCSYWLFRSYCIDQ